MREDRQAELISGDGDFRVAWQDHFQWPKGKPNPDYPAGIDLNMSAGRPASCKLSLPYPAKRCGCFFIECGVCGLTVAVSTAGRPDDPRSVTLACKIGSH